MHRPKTERQALARRLLGTATDPGPIDVGWLKRRYGVRGGSYIKRWRETGIPEARIDDLEAALAELMGTTQEAAPDIAGRLETAVTRLETLVSGLVEALARRVADDVDPEPVEPQNDAGSADPVAHDPAPG